MPIRVYWENQDKTIIVREMSASWTWDEYFEAITEVKQLMAEIEHSVDIIVDCRQMQGFPSGAVPNINSANKTYDAKLGIQVIVASSQLIQMIASVLGKMSPQANSTHFIFSHTMADAHALIEAHRNAETPKNGV